MRSERAMSRIKKETHAAGIGVTGSIEQQFVTSLEKLLHGSENVKILRNRSLFNTQQTATWRN